MKPLLLLAGLFLMNSFVLNSVFAADDFDVVAEKLKAALASELRTEHEKDRDRNRRPIDTLKFFELRDDMKVIELIPGGGWYSKLLAPVLAEKGEFYVSLWADRVKDKLLPLPAFNKAKYLDVGVSPSRVEGTRFYTIAPFDFGIKDVDIIFTFRNYHNLAQEGRMEINKAALKALKPGGIYAVVDHTRRHMQKLNNENGRRVDPVQAIKEIEQSGFEFVDYSSIHSKADDELRYEVGRKSVTGNTDRFTFKFRKPVK